MTLTMLSSLSPVSPVLFSLALFLSAGLLFIVELMIAKMILPLLGGTPAVWNTCMMFFQALLLIGYAYAHLISGKAGVTRQIVLHLAVFLAACIVLPVALPRDWLPPAEGSPIGYILVLLLISVGLPFFVLSVNSVLLQRWFSGTGHPSAKDPYFLYSASNLGSMVGLIAYPTLIEPYFRLVQQGRMWTLGYVILLVLVVLCGLVTGKSRATPGEAEESEVSPSDGQGLTMGKRVRWVVLAFVPSSLMLGVTTFLSTDVAAIPLFWVIPLSLYLLSFIIVFARVPVLVHRVMVLLLPVTITFLIFLTFSDVEISKWAILLLHLVNLFVYAMVCHGEIAATRPGPGHLTEFYIWLSVGGVLGGIFNSLIAPLVFSTVLEYPLILILGALLLPVESGERRFDRRDWRFILLYLGVPIVLVLCTYWLTNTLSIDSLHLDKVAAFLHVEKRMLFQLITFGVLFFFANGLLFLKRPFLYGIGVAALIMTLHISKEIDRDIVHRERSFFGVLTVEREEEGKFMSLFHGTTLHGKQWLDPHKRFEPLTYYHATGPAGRVFSEFSGDKRKQRIAVIGLGTGSLAAYAGPGQEIDIYEIDGAVKRIATNTAYFSYLTDCRAKWKIILGDGRLTLEKAPADYYGIIVLDAFSSDAIPVHLLTKEAIGLYFSKLTRDGVLLVHISNQYLDLAPVLFGLAGEMGYACIMMSDDEEKGDEKNVSTWVLLARQERDFGDLPKGSAWEKITLTRQVRVWTDDFSNIFSVFKW